MTPEGEPGDGAEKEPAAPARTFGRDFLPLRLLRGGWWSLAIAPALAMIVAGWVTSGQTPLYRANASLVVVPSYRVEATVDHFRSLETLERRTVVATLAEVAAARRTLDSAAAPLIASGAELCGGRSASCYWVRGSVVPNTNVVRVEVQGPDPAMVATLADAVAAVAADEARGLYPIFVMRPLSLARAPREPVTPDLRRNLMVAGILGLFLGGVLVLGFEMLRSRRE